MHANVVNASVNGIFYQKQNQLSKILIFGNNKGEIRGFDYLNEALRATIVTC